MKAKTIVTCLSLAAFSSASPTSASTVYSAVKDFSIKHNPGSVWAYFDPNGLLPSETTTANGVPNWLQWYDSQPANCSTSVVDRNKTGSTIKFSTVSQPTTVLRLDPQALGYVAVRFTTPATGTYNIKARFSGIDSNERPHTVTVNYNGTVLFSGKIGAFGQMLVFKKTIALDMNDTLDFVSDTGDSCT